MVKRFSTVRDIYRGSQSYMEKRRGRREMEVTRRRRGGIKRGEPVINPLCALHSLEHPERFTELHREEKRDEGTTGDQEEKRGKSKGERQI